MYYFITNPSSRSGGSKKIWKAVAGILIERNISYQVFHARYAGHVKKLAASITAEHHPCTLIILGGDGTINEVINGIQYQDEITIGIIPTGSSNDFVRSMGLPTDPEEALNQILQPSKYTTLDIGKLSTGTKRRYFSVSAGFGFDASICYESTSSKLKMVLNKLRMGKLTYVFLAIKQLFHFKPGPVEIQLDGKDTYVYKKVYFISAMNHPYEGGGLKLAPFASPRDGCLDVCIVEGYPRFIILCLLPTAFFGKHTVFKHVHMHRCQEINIVSSDKYPIHTDGEATLGCQSVKMECVPEKLRLITK